MKSLIACTMAVLFALAITVPLLAQTEIDLNTASSMELQRLPRVGPALAQNIIEYREQHGPFNNIQEATRVPRIGAKTLQGMIEAGAVVRPVEEE